jgi:hypothetical protein
MVQSGCQRMNPSHTYELSQAPAVFPKDSAHVRTPSGLLACPLVHWMLVREEPDHPEPEEDPWTRLVAEGVRTDISATRHRKAMRPPGRLRIRP